MDDPWNISPELEAIKSKLVQLGAGDHTGMFLSIIETAASQASHPSTVKSPNRAPFKDTLGELNRLHRSLARLYRDKVDRLARALNEETTRTEAAEAIRALIEKIRLVPNDGTLRIGLFGELAALINLANGTTRSKEKGTQVTSVAGARSHLY